MADFSSWRLKSLRTNGVDTGIGRQLRRTGNRLVGFKGFLYAAIMRFHPADQDTARFRVEDILRMPSAMPIQRGGRHPRAESRAPEMSGAISCSYGFQPLLKI